MRAFRGRSSPLQVGLAVLMTLVMAVSIPVASMSASPAHAAKYTFFVSNNFSVTTVVPRWSAWLRLPRSTRRSRAG